MADGIFEPRDGRPIGDQFEDMLVRLRKQYEEDAQKDKRNEEEKAKLSDGWVESAKPLPFSDRLLGALMAPIPEPPRPPWYKRLYYRAADRVWRWRFRLAEKIAGCRLECW